MATPTEIQQNHSNGSISQSPDDEDDFEVISDNPSFATPLASMVPAPEMGEEVRSSLQSDTPLRTPVFTDLFSILSTDHEREALQPILDTLSSTQGILEKLQKSIEDRNEESKDLRDNLKEAKESNWTLQKELEQLMYENKELKSSNDSYEVSVAEMMSKFSLLQDAAAQASVQVNSLQQSADNLADLEKRNKALEEQLNVERKSRESLMVLLAKSNDEREQSQVDANENMKKLVKEIENLKTQNLNESRTRAEVEGLLEQTRAEIVVVKSTAERERNEMLQASLVGSDENLQRMAILERSLVSDGETRKELEKALNERVSELHKERMRVAELDSRINDLNHELEAVKTQLNLKNSEVENARADSNVTMQELADILHNVDGIRNELNEKKAECEKLKMDMEQCQTEKRNYESIVEDCMDENRNLSEAVKIVQRERDELESENRAMRIDYHRRLEAHQN